MRPTISVIVPAYNEEENIEPTVEEILSALTGQFSDYEILLFDDHSVDKTGAVADALAARHPKVKVIHNGRNMGFGYNYRRGVELARLEYSALVPGDNSFSAESLDRIFSQAGQADIVIPYPTNSHVRPLLRRIISRAFTNTMNLLFGMRLRYYNGPVIHRASIVKAVKKTTSGYVYQAEILTRLLTSRYTFKEVGIDIQERKRGVSKALRVRNIISVIKTIIRLLYEVKLKRERVRV